MKNHIKKAGGALIRNTFSYGGFSKLKIILMYHRVCDKMPNELHDPAMFVTARTLDMHVRELKRYFEVVPVDQLVMSRHEPDRQCALTFDDGWLDNYTVALPVLKKHNVPATVFIPLERMKTRNHYWFQAMWDVANAALTTGKREKLIKFLSSYGGMRIRQESIQESICSVINMLKELPPQKLERIIDEAIADLGVELPWNDDLMTNDQMLEMSAARVTFGAHGLNHAILTRLSSEGKKREIFGSRELLAGSGLACSDVFSYPNGDWDDEAAALVRQVGYLGAVTTQLGHVKAVSKAFQFNRVALHDEISNTPSLFWFRIFQATL